MVVITEVATGVAIIGVVVTTRDGRLLTETITDTADAQPLGQA